MAIFQPTNITPSTFAGVGGGVVDATANITISWQVNGNSPMTGFTIDVFENSAEAATVHSQTVTLIDPFYGTDSRGIPQYYVYTPGVTWASWGLSNGNSYKFRITQNWGASSSVVQNTENVFVTRSAPTLSVSPASGTTLTSVGQTFTATYAQADGDAVNWIRWILTDSSGNEVDDTGAIYTQQLSYAFDRLFDGETYTLVCIVETESGVEVTATGTYSVSYSGADASGEISVTCNPDDSVTLHWAKAATVPGTPSPSTGWGTAVGGELNLNSGATVTWDTINPGEADEQAVSVAKPYLAGWRGEIGTTDTLTGSGTIPIPADKAPNKTYAGTGTATDTVTADSMTKVPKNDLTGTDTLSLPVTTVKYLDSQITYSGSPSLPEPGGVITEVFSDELNTIGFALYVYRGSDGYHSYLRWTSYFEPISVTRLSGETYNDLRSTATTDENGTTIYDNYLLAEDGVSQWRNTITVKKFTLKIRYRYYQYTGTYTPAHDGLNSISITSMDPALRASGEPFAPQIKTTVSDGDGTFNIEAVAGVSGTYPLGVQYKYAYEGVGAYEGTYSGVFDAELPPVTWERGQLKSASVLSVAPNSVGATASATVTVGSNNAYTVKFTSSANIAPSATIQFTYNSPTTGADSYWFTVTINLPTNAEGGIGTVTTDATGGYTITQTGTRTYKLTVKDDGANTINYSYTYGAIAYDAGKAITLGGTPSTVLEWVAVSTAGARLTVSVKYNGSQVGTLQLPVKAWFAAFTLMKPSSGKDVIKAYSWDKNGVALSTVTLSNNSMLPTPVTSVVLTGKQTASWVALSKDPNANFIPSPEWTTDMVLYARFNGSLEAGTLGSGGDVSVMIYREQDGMVEPVGLMGTNVTQITDYGIRSGASFRYVGYYVTSGAYSSGMVSEEICLKLRKFTLVEAEPDAENPNTYHPVRVFSFRANIDGGTYSNTNAPVLLDNFTAYPLRQPSPKNALTGTLTGLLGYFENGEYVNDTVALAKAVHALSVSDNPLFLRDMKGNMFMVGTSGSITSTINNMTGAMPTTVSIPWVEIGDADAAMIYTIDEAV